MELNKYVVEYSSDDRSKCHGKCQQIIRYGQLRFSFVGGHGRRYWSHFCCKTVDQIASIGTSQNISGLETLKSIDRGKVLLAFGEWEPQLQQLPQLPQSDVMNENINNGDETIDDGIENRLNGQYAQEQFSELNVCKRAKQAKLFSAIKKKLF